MTRVQLTDEEWEFIEPYLPIGRLGLYPERLRRQFERLINKLKAWRGIATRYDKTPQSYLAGLPTHGYREAPGGSSCCSTRMRLPSHVDVGVRLCRISQLTACSADVGAAPGRVNGEVAP
ncbi:hypothetical protein [Frankia sp. Mgl5]|uniref:hypothetical protein n=1 Tax=Frankia sp. Mgl5 TaxID=2933793 RepID=UPI002551FE97|nr:hypothetical protein [Frankia sp. Mgl5]